MKKRIEIYEDTYAGLRRIAVRTMSAGNRVRYGRQVWVVIKRDGLWQLGYTV